MLRVHFCGHSGKTVHVDGWLADMLDIATQGAGSGNLNLAHVFKRLSPTALITSQSDVDGDILSRCQKKELRTAELEQHESRKLAYARFLYLNPKTLLVVAQPCPHLHS